MAGVDSRLIISEKYLRRLVNLLFDCFRPVVCRPILNENPDDKRCRYPKLFS